MSVKINQIEEEKQEAEDKKGLSRKQVLSISLVLSVLLSAAVFFLYVYPQWTRVGQGQEIDVQDLRAQLRQKEQTLEQLNALRANYEDIPEGEVQTLGTILPEEQLTPELLSQFETIARSSGVNLRSVSVDETRQADTRSARERVQAQGQGRDIPDIRTVNIRLDVNAFSYQNFERFLANLQKNARVLDVQQFGYTSESQNHSLVIDTYYLPVE